MNAHLNVEKTSTGISVALTGDQIEPFTVATHFGPRPYIGKYVVDMILDTVYLKRYAITINGAVVFESFDAERDYEDFIRLINAASKSFHKLT